MGRLKQKGKSGAAKAYMTRTAAVKKLQCSLADFRRLCILKGIFPREPRHRKRANKGSSAPTTFYYTKDIIYLQHEPVLRKLREHKAFAKKLSRALGRGEWSIAKSLEENNKPVYKLDHIIKERYPTFIDALRDIDDALCLVTLFASLPSNDKIPASLIENCAKLQYQWQLYIMNTNSLRKVFLSIKGVYYQAEVQGEKITWLVPYQFTQTVPSDVDVRVMLTFLELYQTLLGFVFFKLYMDEGWVYPPPLDLTKDEGGAGVGAFSLQNITKPMAATNNGMAVKAKVSGKEVKQTIKALAANVAKTNGADHNTLQSKVENLKVQDDEEDEEFVAQPSKSEPNLDISTLPTLKSLALAPSSAETASQLFKPYTFFLSRETPRWLMEFTIRAFGGRVGWPATSGSGSPFNEDDDSITHVIIDRPLIVPQSSMTEVQQDENKESEEQRNRRQRRKYVQPQWVMDCVNAGKILGEEKYARGAELPPHLSPFGEAKGAYEPQIDGDERMDVDGEVESESESEIEGEPDEEEEELDDDRPIVEEDDAQLVQTKSKAKNEARKLAKKSVQAQDQAAVRAAELEAEAAGIEFAEFTQAIKEETKSVNKKQKSQNDEPPVDNEKDMNKMMMSNKQRKLYEKMKYGQNKRNAEKLQLEKKKQAIVKAKRKEARSMK